MKGLAFIAISIVLFSSCSKSTQTAPVSPASSTTTGGGTFTTLLSFNGTNGEYPFGSLIVSGNTLYGMASAGGKYGDGIIFSIGTNGSGFTDLHDFGGSDGEEPCADLTLSGNSLYGTTKLGGAYGKGAIFSIATGGSGFTLLHSFGSGADGIFPESDLTINGTTMYGTTSAGGASGKGTIFSISLFGSNYNCFYDLNPTYAYSPIGGVMLSPNDTLLYGTASEGGGIYNDGVIYYYNLDSAKFEDLLVFDKTNGATPEGSLLLSGTELYGMTNAGGKNNIGNIFSFNTVGNVFKDMLDFNGANGTSPIGNLIINGNTLYGMTNTQEGNTRVEIFFPLVPMTALMSTFLI
jgi:uncharacterized repeat protein (TIGR03803 family)